MKIIDFLLKIKTQQNKRRKEQTDSTSSGIMEREPKKRESENKVLKEGDRIEIYRPLVADPKEARKRRAEKLKADQLSSQ